MARPGGNPDVTNGKIGRRFTKENASEMGKKGGKASTQKQREKRLLKDYLEYIMQSDFKVKGKDEPVSGAEAICLAITAQALKGSPEAFKTIRDTLGQKPVDKVEQLNTNITVDFGDIENDD